MRVWLASAALLGVVGAAGCSPDTTRSTKDVFNARAELPSCGTVTVGHGEEPPDAAVRCLASAVGGSLGAELVVTRPTVEGDPVVTYYRAVPGSTKVEVFKDSTKDKFGSREWHHFMCTGVQAKPLQATGCPEGLRP